jgi:hypothetical protein
MYSLDFLNDKRQSRGMARIQEKWQCLNLDFINRRGNLETGIEGCLQQALPAKKEE